MTSMGSFSLLRQKASFSSFCCSYIVLHRALVPVFSVMYIVPFQSWHELQDLRTTFSILPWQFNQNSRLRQSGLMAGLMLMNCILFSPTLILIVGRVGSLRLLYNLCFFFNVSLASADCSIVTSPTSQPP